MATKRYLIHGAPGTGKTRKLVELFVKLADQVGPERVAAVTYTRAAADEFRFRAARALGIAGDREDLRREMPWVGTIHSLAHRLAGRPKLISDKQVRDFCLGASADPEDWDSNQDPEGVKRATAIRVHSLSWARGVSFERAYRDLRTGVASWDEVLDRVHMYQDYLRTNHLNDFDTLIERARLSGQHPPVKALLVDEAQDNTALLWSLIEQWALSIPILACVGDPWQALYTYSGADPKLFLETPGEWRVLKVSHRLARSDAQYARRILKLAGWDDPRLDAWHGEGGFTRDNRTFYLARTKRMLRDVERELISLAVPFRRFDGSSPLETRAAEACRTWIRLREGERLPVTQIQSAMRAASRDQRLGIIADRLDKYVGEEILEGTFRSYTDLSPTACLMATPWGDYVNQVWATHGPEAACGGSQTYLGSIHSAKGREADKVVVVTGWGREPGNALDTEQGRLWEACVAYVAATRHRTDLAFLEGGYGRAYPFPNRYDHAVLEGT